MIEVKTKPQPAAPVAAATSAVVDSTAVDSTALPIVIIGSGYAGYGLAEAIRQRNPETPVVVFTADDGHHYSKPALSNALARGKGADDLVSETPLALEQRLNIRIYARCHVLCIDAENKRLETDAGTQAYSKLVLALGANPIHLPLAGSGAEDVLSVNDLQDYRAMRQRLQSSTKVTIIGSGLIGCEFANDMALSGYQVDVIGLADSPMERLLPPEIGLQLQEALQKQGVNWYLGNTAERIDREGDQYRVVLRDGTERVTDLVISAVGLRPHTELAKAMGAEVNHGIQVNGGMRTSVPDVFAIGDCVEINGQLLPYLAPINHGIRALADTLLGRPTMVNYPPMPVIVKTPALPLTLLVPPQGMGGIWQVENEAQGCRAFFLDAAECLQGFVLAGEPVSERQFWVDQCGQKLKRSVA
ncbi:MAG: FAD-dependent oxidoreductase [Natronospirillum sp.]